MQQRITDRIVLPAKRRPTSQSKRELERREGLVERPSLQQETPIGLFSSWKRIFAQKSNKYRGARAKKGSFVAETTEFIDKCFAWSATRASMDSARPLINCFHGIHTYTEQETCAHCVHGVHALVWRKKKIAVTKPAAARALTLREWSHLNTMHNTSCAIKHTMCGNVNGYLMFLSVGRTSVCLYFFLHSQMYSKRALGAVNTSILFSRKSA